MGDDGRNDRVNFTTDDTGTLLQTQVDLIFGIIFGEFSEEQMVTVFSFVKVLDNLIHLNMEAGSVYHRWAVHNGGEDDEAQTQAVYVASGVTAFLLKLHQLYQQMGEPDLDPVTPDLVIGDLRIGEQE